MTLEEGPSVLAISLPRPWPQAILDGHLAHVALMGVASWVLDDAGVLLALHASKAYDEDLARGLLERCGYVAQAEDVCPTGLVGVGEVGGLHAPAEYGCWTLTFSAVVPVKPYAMPGLRGVWALPDQLARRIRAMWDDRPVP